MRLLVLTQKVDQDDEILGFFHTWISLFSEHTDSVEVITLSEGRHDLPKNVHVHSMRKKSGDPQFQIDCTMQIP